MRDQLRHLENQIVFFKGFWTDGHIVDDEHMDCCITKVSLGVYDGSIGALHIDTVDVHHCWVRTHRGRNNDVVLNSRVCGIARVAGIAAPMDQLILG